jgi:hypothetical protein
MYVIGILSWYILVGASEIQGTLRARYERFRLEADVPLSLAPRLSSPLLVAVSDSWLASKFRILVVGQEVLRWAFREGQYYDWPFNAIASFQEFKTNQHAVEALIYAYRVFDFSKHQPENARSPFWTAYRRLRASLEKDKDSSVLWTNLFRMSIDGGSVIKNGSSEELLNLQIAQAGLLTDEIRILQPKVVVFFTGPNYDNALVQEFPGIEYRPFKSWMKREVALLSHSELPLCAFRTYHPGFLRRRRLWPILDEVIESIREV